VRGGGEAWGKELPRMWSIKAGLAATGIHYLADCFRALLARLVDCRVSSVVTVKLIVAYQATLFAQIIGREAQLSIERPALF
jgi:hypothetical protein